MSDPSTASRSRAWVEVRLDRVRENALTVLRDVGPSTRLLPMVKADAYGLGMARVFRALSEIPGPAPWGFGVASVAEGEALREEGWEGRVLAFTPAPPGELERAAAARLTLCLSDVESIGAWARAASASGDRLSLHVEVDTGMGRAGLPWDQAAHWAPAVRAATAGAVEWEGCYTHFHSADEPELAPTDEQWARFRSALSHLPEDVRGSVLIHSSNSAASLRRGGFGCDLARPGIFLYGGAVGAEVAPLAVAAIRARLVLVRDVQPGATMGYGATYVAAGPERWGTVAIGYGDGLPRALSPGGGEALVHGRRVPIIGRVSMDMTALDISSVPQAAPGDVVTFVGRDGGEEITVDEVAARCGTISYEILTGLTPRLPRVYLDVAEGTGSQASEAASFPLR